MESENLICLMAGLKNDPHFWSLSSSIMGMSFEEDHKGSLAHLGRLLKKVSPAICLISTSLITDVHRALFPSFLQKIECPVIMAGSFNTQEDEFIVRRSGIYCFLLLPDELALVESAIQGALRVSRKHMSNYLKEG